MQKWTTHIEITTKKAIELAFKATMDKKGAEKGCDHCDLSFHMYIGSDILKIIFLSVFRLNINRQKHGWQGSLHVTHAQF